MRGVIRYESPAAGVADLLEEGISLALLGPRADRAWRLYPGDVHLPPSTFDERDAEDFSELAAGHESLACVARSDLHVMAAAVVRETDSPREWPEPALLILSFAVAHEHEDPWSIDPEGLEAAIVLLDALHQLAADRGLSSSLPYAPPAWASWSLLMRLGFVESPDPGRMPYVRPDDHSLRQREPLAALRRGVARFSREVQAKRAQAESILSGRRGR